MFGLELVVEFALLQGRHFGLKLLYFLGVYMFAVEEGDEYELNFVLLIGSAFEESIDILPDF